MKYILTLFIYFPFVANSAVTLNEALKSAIQKNEVVGQAREQVKQAEEQVSQAKAAPLPSLHFNATHTIQPEPADPIARAFFPERQTTTNLTLTQPLFRGAREFAGLRQRKNLLEATKAQEINTLAQLYERVSSSYLDVVYLEQDLKNLNEQKDIYEARVKDLLGRTRRGESSSTEAITAQAHQASHEAEIHVVQARLKTARENFSLLTGLAPNSDLRDESTEKTSDPGALDFYLGKLEERADVKSAKERFMATEEEVRIVRGAHWPTLDLVGNYYFQRPGSLYEGMDWDAQFRLTLPIFEGGLRFSQTREALSRRSQAELELKRTRRQAVTEIRSLHEGLKMRTQQVVALKKSTELSQKNYQVLQRDFRRGLTRNIDVQLALTEYGASRRALDQARIQAKLDKIRLEVASAILPSIIQGKE